MGEETEFRIKIKTYVHPIEIKRFKKIFQAVLELKFIPDVIEIQEVKK